MRKIMAVIDIGSKTTKLLVGEMTNNKFNTLSISESETKGIKKGQITSEEELQTTIESVLKDSESKLNLPIKKLIAIIPSYDLEFTIGEAKIEIESETVKGSDISRSILESYKGIVPDNMELVNAIPMSFKLDNNEVVNDPKNMISKTLSVKTLLMMSPKNNVYKILSILDKLNLDIVDISIDAVGDYYTFKNDKTNKGVTAIINIGHSKTTISIFNKGIITNLTNIEIGSRNIDNDIAYIYKVDLNTAIKLKEEFAFAHPSLSSIKDDIEVLSKDNKTVVINNQEISKVVYSRLKEILQKTKKELNHLTKREINYIIVTGGITEMSGFEKTLNSVYQKSANIGTINELGVRNNKYSSVIGLIKWYNELELLKDKDYSIFSLDEQQEFSGISNKVDNDSVINKFFSYFID